MKKKELKLISNYILSGHAVIEDITSILKTEGVDKLTLTNGYIVSYRADANYCWISNNRNDSESFEIGLKLFNGLVRSNIVV